jgi:Ran GTPase-activating protein (RanGAP) involved in mRNA processing and transport
MSKTIKKLYKQIFNQLKTDYGFRLRNNTFYRVVNNQMYQSVSLQISQFGHSFTLNVGITPICSGVFLLDSGDLRLGHLYAGYDHWWEYGLQDSLDEEKVMRNVFRIFMECAMPVLNEITNYSCYIKEIVEIEKNIYGEALSTNFDIVWVGAITNNFSEAIKILNWYDAHIADDLHFKRKQNADSEEFKDYLEEAEAELADIRRFSEALENGDEDYIHQKIRDEEAKSWEFLGKIGISKEC